MKKSTFGLIAMAALLMATLVWISCTKDEEATTGSIYGIVTDFATGEPVGNANVKLKPTGETTLTGSDGAYEFRDLKPRNYSLQLSKAGYNDLDDDYVIEVEAGKKTKRDVQMSKQVASLKITDMAGNSITELDFGMEESITTKSFNIFNNGPESLSWEITITANWLQVSKQSGTLTPGKQQSVIATINRELLLDGENVTTLHVTSDNGAKELTVKAMGVSPIVTLAVTECTGRTAVLNGKLTRVGDPVYTEMGFVYGTMPAPSISNGATRISISNVQLGKYSEAISNLTEGSTYYVRAYAKNNVTTDYGMTVSFVAENPEYVVLSNGIMVQRTDLGKADWNSANEMCNNSTVGGYLDWRLPTLAELYAIFNNRDLIGGFVNEGYWSSTQNVNYYNDPMGIDFGNGTSFTEMWHNMYNIRAVRTIND